MNDRKRKLGELEAPGGKVTGGKVPVRAPDTTSELVKKIIKEKKKTKGK